MGEEENPVENKIDKWTNTIVTAGGVIAAILAVSGGSWIMLGLVIVGVIGFFYFRGMIRDYQFENAKKKAGDKVGEESSEQTKKLDDNRSQGDDFFGRKPR